jgi:hypothetical protein
VQSAEELIIIGIASVIGIASIFGIADRIGGSPTESHIAAKKSKQQL